MTVVSAAACFRIRGVDIMEIARQRFLEREPRSAFQLLMASLGGGEPGQAEHCSARILDGTHALEGDESGLVVIEKASPEYQAAVKKCYAGTVRMGKFWYRPKSIIADLGREDVPEDGLNVPIDLPEFNRQLRAWWRQRNEFYLNASAGEICEPVGPRGRYVIFELCAESPHWWPEARDPRQSITDFLNAGNDLQVTGHSAVIGSMKAFDIQTATLTSATTFREEQGQPKRSRRIKTTDPLREQKIAAQKEEAEEQIRLADLARQEELRILREMVLAQCNNDLFLLTLADGRAFQIPRAPFYHWALRRTKLAHLAPPWTPVAREGWKCPMDDPYHTDWMVGAGIPLSESYEAALRDATIDKMIEVQEQFGHFEVGVIVSGDEVTGTIGEDVITLPDLSPEHLPSIRSARAILTERGGQLAHLAQVALERSIPILRVEDACRRFRKGDLVTVDANKGTVRVHEVERQHSRKDLS